MSAQAVHVRKATHAGSWYSSSATELNDQLENWLKLAGEPSHTPARAIIVPHAGYRYCGACAAYAYKQIDPTVVKHVFILGPSHFASMNNCGLSPARIYHTPLGDLNIDNKIYEELYETGEFKKVSLSTDEEEHSIEMQLPYIAKVMENQNFTIVPVMVGAVSADQQCKYGKIFGSYLADPCNLFVISSDFCHWGSRFHFQFYEKSWGEIHQSIEKLDQIGMKTIEELSPSKFTAYLQKYSNTICGRRVIGVLLNAVQSLQNVENNMEPSLKFLNYAQSSRCLDKRDSSVSYAAASLIIS